jgi:hypothetical protein
MIAKIVIDLPRVSRIEQADEQIQTICNNIGIAGRDHDQADHFGKSKQRASANTL